MQTKATTIIDERLRFIFFGLQSILGITFSGKTIEEIFSNSEDNQVSEKKYVLVESKKHKIYCFVEGYEPETIILYVDSKSIDQTRLDFIVENSEYEFFRLKEKDNNANAGDAK